MRILFALPGLHRYHRGAEIALIALAEELVRKGDEVTLMGSGAPRTDAPYRFIRVPSIKRERFESFPRFPILRGETSYEEASFALGLWRRFRPTDYDATLTCSYPFLNWVLRARGPRDRRPAHIFVTQNGDWPALSQDAEYAWFGCDGLVCTNPEYFERNQESWRAALVPNGIDVARFAPGPPERGRFSLPEDRRVVLMVSALIPSKRVAEGIEAVAQLPDVHLVVAGDGPMRGEIDALAAARLPGRFSRVSIGAEAMPALYRSADAFLHLSLEESFGNVFLEALACGLPIVAHDTARVRWIVGDEEHLVDTTDLTSAAAALAATWTAPTCSPEQRANRAKRFAWSSVAEQYRTFIRDVIAAKRPPAASTGTVRF